MRTTLDVSTAIATLDRLSSNDEGRSGAKAFNCARLKQAGFRVPGGLVVKADATDADIAAIAEHPWLDEVPPGTWESTATLRSVSGVLWKLTPAAGPEEQVAVSVTLTVWLVGPSGV